MGGGGAQREGGASGEEVAVVTAPSQKHGIALKWVEKH